MSPVCSILIPTYNQDPHYLSAAIQSARLQTAPVEVCICDDGSNPDQEAVVDAVQREQGHATTKYTYQPNGGVAAALNTCLEMAVCDWIAWLPSDDLFRPNHIETMVESLTRADGKVAYSSYEEGVPITSARWAAAQFPDRELLFETLQRGCFINAATLVWHRSVFGNWNTDMRHAQDFEHIMRCAQRWNFIAVHNFGVRRRIHDQQMINTLSDPVEYQTKVEDMAYLKEQYGVTGGVWAPEEQASFARDDEGVQIS
jgi:glycosyltransferase involved in cell wall biosynthesis